MKWHQREGFWYFVALQINKRMLVFLLISLLLPASDLPLHSFGYESTIRRLKVSPPSLKILRPTWEKGFCVSKVETLQTPVLLLQWDLSESSAERRCSFQQRWPFIYLPCPPFLWCIIPLTSRGGGRLHESTNTHVRLFLTWYSVFHSLQITAHAECLCFLCRVLSLPFK